MNYNAFLITIIYYTLQVVTTRISQFYRASENSHIAINLLINVSIFKCGLKVPTHYGNLRNK